MPDTWTYEYTADTSPVDDGFVADDRGADITIAGGTIAIVNQLTEGTYFGSTWEKDGIEFNNETGYTVEARLKATCEDPTIDTVIIYGNDPIYYWEVIFLSDRVQLDVTPDGWLTDEYVSFELDATEFHTYRITVQGSVIKLYVDNDFKGQANLIFLGSPTETPYIGFGNWDIATPTTSEWDYVRYSVAGPVEPSADETVVDALDNFVYQSAFVKKMPCSTSDQIADLIITRKHFNLISTGDCFVNFDKPATDAGRYLLKANEPMSLDISCRKLHYLADASATLYVVATR